MAEKKGLVSGKGGKDLERLAQLARLGKEEEAAGKKGKKLPLEKEVVREYLERELGVPEGK